MRAFSRLPIQKRWQAASLLGGRFEFDVLPLTDFEVLVRQTLKDMVERKLNKQSKKTLDGEAELAKTLSNLAVALSRQGRGADALSAAKQALDMLQRLAQSKPERFEPDWATSLSNYANHLSEQGRIDEALSAAKQALDMLQRLAETKPLRYLSTREHARLTLALFQRLASSEALLDEIRKPLPGVATSRQRRAIEFQKHCLLAICEPSSTTVEDTINSAIDRWSTLDAAQKHDWEAFHLLVQALAEYKFGFGGATLNWREQLMRYRLQRQGHLPWWMMETARRAGVYL